MCAGLEAPHMDLMQEIPVVPFSHTQLPRAPGAETRTQGLKPGHGAPLDAAMRHQPCATLDTHSKKSSRSGGYLLKSAVRFLAASSLARQESWQRQPMPCQCQRNGTPFAPAPHWDPWGSQPPVLPLLTWAPLSSAVLFCSPSAKARMSAAGRLLSGMHGKPCRSEAERLR